MKKALLAALIVIMGLGAITYFTVKVEGSHLSEKNNFRRNPILEGEVIETQVVVEGEEVYMSFEAVRKFMYPHIEMNDQRNKVLVKVHTQLFQFEDDELNDYIQQEEEITLQFNTKTINNEVYLPIKSLDNLLGYEVNYFKERDGVIIDKKDTQVPEGTLNKEAYLINVPKTIARRIARLQKGDIVKIYGEEDQFYYAKTERGELGYIRKDHIKEVRKTIPIADKIVFNNIEPWKPNGKIGLVWDYVYYHTKERSDEEKIEAVDIFSPTWFDLVDEDGSIDNKGDFHYVEYMKDKGYQIWGLVTNSFDPDLTSKFLADEVAQDHFISQILIYSGIYQLDGINIDFENIYYKDQEAFTKFVAKLTEKAHQMNLIVSIDVTIPSTSPNWSMVYDRAKLGEIVDYVAVMTYDEHWGTSPKSGSVASIGWVERGIQQTLALVPAEKVLLGLPFYTRLWEEELQSDGNVKVSSKAYGMKQIRDILAENNADIEWDEKTGQYYSEFQKEGKTYKVWLEDSRSLELKVSLIEKYNLAGFAAWRKDFETEDVWIPLRDIK